ncbi:hypothetical protein STEG23_007595 [Scotinomys teguina]
MMNAAVATKQLTGSSFREECTLVQISGRGVYTGSDFQKRSVHWFRFPEEECTLVQISGRGVYTGSDFRKRSVHWFRFPEEECTLVQISGRGVYIGSDFWKQLHGVILAHGRS